MKHTLRQRERQTEKNTNIQRTPATQTTHTYRYTEQQTYIQSETRRRKKKNRHTQGLRQTQTGRQTDKDTYKQPRHSYIHTCAETERERDTGNIWKDRQKHT